MKRLPRGLRKYIRKEKARVRREFLGEAQRRETLKIIFEAIKIPPTAVGGNKNQTKDLKKRKPISKKLAKGANLHEE